VINTLRLTKHFKDPGEADQLLLDHLTKTVAKESPDTTRYSATFNLDDLSAWLIDDLEESPYSALRHSVKDARASARRRAIITLKLHGLFRSSDCLLMQRGSLFRRFALRQTGLPLHGSHGGDFRRALVPCVGTPAAHQHQDVGFSGRQVLFLPLRACPMPSSGPLHLCVFGQDARHCQVRRPRVFYLAGHHS